MVLGSSDDDEYDDDEYDSDDLSYESTESERYLEKLEFEEDVLGKIESNDPALTKLIIHPFSEGYRQLSANEWSRLGEAIGRNTHLQDVSLNDFRGPYADRFYHILPGFARNRSIQKLRIQHLDLLRQDVSNFLIQFFTNNRVIEFLRVIECLRVDRNSGLEGGLRALASALQMCHSLKEVEIYTEAAEDDHWFCVDCVLRSLTGHIGLETLSLFGVSIEDCAAVRTIPMMNIRAIDLGNVLIDDEVAIAFADAISGNSSLKELVFRSAVELHDNGWEAIIDALQRSRFRLEKLSMACNIMPDNKALSLANSLLHHSASLRFLNLSELLPNIDGHSITIVGWRSLFQLLREPNSILEELDLSTNLFGNEVVDALTNALIGNETLRKLILSDNPHVSVAAWASLSVILRNLHSALDILDLNGGYIHGDGNHINSDTMVAFADTLASNRKLKELILCINPDRVNYRVAPDGYGALINSLCNKTSIMSTYHSNHTLQKICCESVVKTMPNELTYLLNINKFNNRSQAARLKIIKTHFSGPTINMQPFGEMDVQVRPHAIAWMAKEDNLYQYLRTMPLLLEKFVKKGEMVLEKRKLDL
jgi:hypothetical protein